MPHIPQNALFFLPTAPLAAHGDSLKSTRWKRSLLKHERATNRSLCLCLFLSLLRSPWGLPGSTGEGVGGRARAGCSFHMAPVSLCWNGSESQLPASCGDIAPLRQLLLQRGWGGKRKNLSGFCCSPSHGSLVLKTWQSIPHTKGWEPQKGTALLWDRLCRTDERGGEHQ